MAAELLSPREYLPSLERIRAGNPYARKWALRLERKTNRHPETSGRAWGWYEVWPLGITVGFWSDSGRDDLRGTDIGKWNAEAQEVSAARATGKEPGDG